MGAEVTKRVQGTPLAKKLEVILGDVIKMPEMPPCDALISNTPYQISSPLIFKMLAMPNPPRVAVLMVSAPKVKYRGYGLTAGCWVVPKRVCEKTGCEAG
jgi:16S rRNA A1518/A1519 N6-dimethyltransferase RsmA/KsgA/DIM1 with predicted DNA glycosylase/AP lyase activity